MDQVVRIVAHAPRSSALLGETKYKHVISVGKLIEALKLKTQSA